jgi:hypothetical protein
MAGCPALETVPCLRRLPSEDRQTILCTVCSIYDEIACMERDFKRHEPRGEERLYLRRGKDTHMEVLSETQLRPHHVKPSCVSTRSETLIRRCLLNSQIRTAS